jgi:hypothetical protein
LGGIGVWEVVTLLLLAAAVLVVVGLVALTVSRRQRSDR